MESKYKIGEKIKSRRLALGKTQKEIAGDKISRNMLSLIEASKAIPSLETLEYLASALDIPMAYFVSEVDALFTYEKGRKLPLIKKLYENGDYDGALQLIASLSDSDDELNYIAATSAFTRGRELLLGGSLISAQRMLENAIDFANKTIYSTVAIEVLSRMYLAVTANIQSPLLEMDTKAFESDAASIIDFDFYKYLTLDYAHKYTNPLFAKHMDAKRLIKRYAYTNAIPLLLEIEDMKNTDYNACVLFGVYSDLEFCYKQIGDFENAYRYSSKRMALISAFKA